MENKSSNYVCKICDMVFKKKRYLEDHLKSISHLKNCKEDVVEQYRCDICNKSYAQKRYLNTHLQSKKHILKSEGDHILSADRFDTTMMECEICKSIIQRRNYHIHIRSAKHKMAVEIIETHKNLKVSN